MIKMDWYALSDWEKNMLVHRVALRQPFGVAPDYLGDRDEREPLRREYELVKEQNSLKGFKFSAEVRRVGDLDTIEGFGRTRVDAYLRAILMLNGIFHHNGADNSKVKALLSSPKAVAVVGPWGDKWQTLVTNKRADLVVRRLREEVECVLSQGITTFCIPMAPGFSTVAGTQIAVMRDNLMPYVEDIRLVMVSELVIKKRPWWQSNPTPLEEDFEEKRRADQTIALHHSKEPEVSPEDLSAFDNYRLQWLIDHCSEIIAVSNSTDPMVNKYTQAFRDAKRHVHIINPDHDDI